MTLEPSIPNELSETPIDWAEIEIRSAPVASFGPTARDREISACVYGEGIPEYSVCCWWGISPVTCRNIARRTMKWCAREQGRLDRMSLPELLAEQERLEDLFGKANSAWHASKKAKIAEREKTWTRKGKTESVLTITRTPQTGNVRFLEIAMRLAGRLRIVATEIEVRRAGHVSNVPVARSSQAEPSAARPGKAGLRHEYVPRTRKRKRMGGRGLRLPRCVGTAPRPLSATAAWKRFCVAQRLNRGVRYAGIPPPD